MGQLTKMKKQLYFKSGMFKSLNLVKVFRLQYYFSIAIFLFLFSCSQKVTFKDKRLSRDIEAVSSELEKMKVIDQYLRYADDYMQMYYGRSSFMYFLDRRTWGELTDSAIYDPMEGRVKMDSLKRLDYNKALGKYIISEKYLNEINTKRLIEITKQYGFPSHERLKQFVRDTTNTSLTSSPMLIFVHAPETYKEQLKQLVRDEYIQKRIDTRVCSHIFWHLNGREPLEIDFDYCKCFDE